MGLLDKLKSLFGSDQNRQSPARETQADVTVEHEPEPAAASEHAVKGTDTGRQQRETRQSQTDDSSEATTATPTTDVEETPETPTPETDESGTEEEPDEEPEAEAEETSEDGPSVEEIKGIGPTYAERLEGAGIETVGDLAAADPADVAEAAETGETRTRDWVERAEDF